MSAVPTRRLFDPNRKTQLEYTPADDQSERGILAQWKRERGPDNPDNYPDDSNCNEVDAAGTFKG